MTHHRSVRNSRRPEARRENGLEAYVMCEIPSNVLLAEAFTEICDGFSISSNELMQLSWA